MIEYRDPRTLEPDEGYNDIYMVGDIEALAISIAKNGVNVPLDITPDNRIITGVRRNVAAIQACLSAVPVNVLDLPKDKRQERRLESNIQRVKTWFEVYNEIRAKRDLIGKKQGARTDLTDAEKINTQHQIADELGIKHHVIRVLEMIGDKPEHKEILARDMQGYSLNKLETTYNKRLANADEVMDDEFPVIDLEPHNCPLCNSRPRRLITDYETNTIHYADDPENDFDF
jgi:ParB-like chromosome segregation protein Spo0J